MKFDEQGHVVSTPKELYRMAVDRPQRLLTGYLMTGTPWAFAEYDRYQDFLEAVAERTGVHPKYLYLRGSCHIGFSIAPKSDKVWTAMGHASDLDLVIVDAVYFHRFEEELRRWEARNPVKSPQEKAAKAAARRAQDRQFNCCRDGDLPPAVCIHHRKTMDRIAALALCGHVRKVSAFIYPDWHSAQGRYEYDSRMLRQGTEEGWLAPAPDEPIPRERLSPATKAGKQAPVAPAPEQPSPSGQEQPKEQTGGAGTN